MSVIYGILAMVWGGYAVQPQWFENGPYEYHMEYETVAECQMATEGTDDICVGDSPSKQFIKALNVKTDESYKEKLDWVECDHWAGCYWGKR